MLNGNLKDSSLDDIKFSKAQLINCRLYGASITSVNFDNALMERVTLNDAQMYDLSMKGSWLDGAEGNNITTLTSCNLTDAKLENTPFIGSDLRTSNFANANLKGANLTGTNLLGINLTEANLTGMRAEDEELKSALLKNVYCLLDTASGSYLVTGELDTKRPKYNLI